MTSANQYIGSALLIVRIRWDSETETFSEMVILQWKSYAILCNTEVISSKQT